MQFLFLYMKGAGPLCVPYFCMLAPWLKHFRSNAWRVVVPFTKHSKRLFFSILLARLIFVTRVFGAYLVLMHLKKFYPQLCYCRFRKSVQLAEVHRTALTQLPLRHCKVQWGKLDIFWVAVDVLSRLKV